ncbi:MAG: metallophosphoesterase, partial [Bacteroidetes bacterium]|nr:metallophosphoesterase [Bacteroidota bacterium]
MQGNSNGIFIIAITILILFLLDLYVFQGIKALTSGLQSEITKSILRWSFWIFFLAFYAALLYAILDMLPSRKISPFFKIVSHGFLAITAAKLVFIVVLLGEDIGRLLIGSWNKISDLAGNVSSEKDFMPDRRRFISQVGIVLAGLPLASIIYGVTKGKYNFKVHKHTIYFDDLPESFDGFTITQISDVHAGSFDDFEAVRRGVELIKAQNSDVVVFTGDMVNNEAKEIQPYMELFKSIEAPFGKYSILGNHDYGDYISWASALEKQNNLNKLIKYQQEMGFKVLLDENESIEKNGQKINILGVENWGQGFGTRGDLDKSLKGTRQNDFKILLSHDPSHWDAQVKNHTSKIQMTLSGHTHGMQFGFEIPGFRWSPSKYRYPNWAGLTEELGRKLYVNRGFGFIGFAGRVGIWPEITVLELKR